MSKNISDEDLKIWEEFTKNMNNIENKDIVYDKENFYKNRIYVLDLHGSTLLEANKKVKNCINLSYASGIRHIKVITGKGRRSKNFYCFSYKVFIFDSTSIYGYSISTIY